MDVGNFDFIKALQFRSGQPGHVELDQKEKTPDRIGSIYPLQSVNSVKVPKLSPRLKSIYESCVPGEPLWDIGCDHGLLGRRGLLDGKFSSYHFVEPSPFAMRSLKENFGEFPKGCEFLECLGENLDWAKVFGNVVIAGMGARSMVSILEKSMAHPHKRRFILSPQWSVPMLLEFFNQHRLPFDQISVREGRGERLIFQIES